MKPSSRVRKPAEQFVPATRQDQLMSAVKKKTDHEKVKKKVQRKKQMESNKNKEVKLMVSNNNQEEKLMEPNQEVQSNKKTRHVGTAKKSIKLGVKKSKK